MAEEKEPIRRIRRGRPLRLSPAQIAELARITESDVAAAREFWRRHAPRKFRNLLDARRER